MTKSKITNLRAAIVQYLETNSQVTIADTSLKDWLEMIKLTEANPNYLQVMKRSSTWGGGPELAAAAQMFQVRIHVQRQGKTVAVFKPANEPTRAELFLHWSGGHYRPIRRT